MKRLKVLLVEDSVAHITLTEHALSKAEQLNGHRFDLNVARDGLESIHYLQKEPPFENVSRPDLVLLDLKLPKMDGFEVLERLKNTKGLRRIPVIMLTTSELETDIAKAYDLAANAYLVKPIRTGEFIDTINHLGDFWGSDEMRLAHD